VEDTLKLLYRKLQEKQEKGISHNKVSVWLDYLELATFSRDCKALFYPKKSSIGNLILKGEK
jgi:hypothetical protein